MPALVDRRAFSDFLALDALGRGDVPDMDETRRRVFVVERRSDYRRPDHFYKGFVDQRLGGLTHVGQVPAHTLGRLASRFLERRKGRLAVRYEVFPDWHDLLPFVSPLAVIAAFLASERRLDWRSAQIRDRLEEEIGATGLAAPCLLGLEDLVEREGLNELHMHLNGSTELDVIWAQHAAVSPRALYQELARSAQENGEAPRELYEQIAPGFGPRDVERRLSAARRVRRLLAEDLGRARAGGSTAVSTDELLLAMSLTRSDADVRRALARRAPPGGALPLDRLQIHPAVHVYGPSAHAPIIQEAAFLLALLSVLRDEPASSDTIGLGLYHNLVAQTLLARIAVQQIDEYGFDQFQKYTLTGVRNFVESSYEARFRQLNGRAPYDTIAHLEGRFAPRDTPAEIGELIRRIASGYFRFRGCGRLRDLLRGAGSPWPPPCLARATAGRARCECGGMRREAEFALVAHFIKRPRRPKDDRAARMRDSGLRSKLERQGRAMRLVLRGNRLARTLVRGVDAASNELHAPPEPFAPTFRLLRRRDVSRATYHVGEDFRHIVSGIRAIAEAVEYLELAAGDRIGHGTAIGLDPALWLSRFGRRLLLPRHDALDDAVFAHRMLIESGRFAGRCLSLENAISRWSVEVYGVEHAPSLLHQAWRLRRLDPMIVRDAEREVSRSGRRIDGAAVARAAGRLSRQRLCEDAAAELRLVETLVGEAPDAYDLFRRRHEGAGDFPSGGNVVEVDAEYLEVEALVELQDRVTSTLVQRGIAIETLPTSNVRISFYERVEDHHLFRWLGLKGPKLTLRPTVVVGSDDPGILATSIRNEYASLFKALVGPYGLSGDDATAILAKLNGNGRTHRFAPPDPPDPSAKTSAPPPPPSLTASSG